MFLIYFYVNILSIGCLLKHLTCAFYSNFASLLKRNNDNVIAILAWLREEIVINMRCNCVRHYTRLLSM